MFDRGTSTTPASDDRLRVLAAPGLLEQDYEVVRDDDSDEEYEQRRAFFALIIDAARKP